MSGSAVLVDEGAFRIDRRKALDKLMRFQLPDARMCLLPLVQCAVASGAKEIRIASADGRLEFAFDGPPFPAKELKDPYQCLFGEGGARAARGRHLAIGLLSALRLNPRSLTVRSVAGGQESLLRLVSVSEDHLETKPASGGAVEPGGRAPRPTPGDASEGGGAVVVLEGGGSPESLLEHVRARCGRCPIPIVVDGAALERPRPDGTSVAFRAGGLSGELWYPLEPLEKSEIDVVSCGATVSTKRLLLPLGQIRGWVRDDALKLNISQTAFVEDKRFERTLGVVRRRSRELLAKALQELGALAPTTGPALLEPSLRRHWMSWEASVLEKAAAFVAPDGGPDARMDAVRRLSILAAAGRSAALARRDDFRKGRRGPVAALWTAPLLFDTEGKGLSLEELGRLRRLYGHIPASERSAPLPVVNGRAAWLPHAADRAFLEAFFPGAAAEVLKGWTEDRIDPEAVVGGKFLAEAKVRFDGNDAAVGLSSQTRAGACRVRWLLRGGPPRLSTFELGSLRLDAVAEANSPAAVGPAEEALRNALKEAAPELYRAAARKYDADAETPEAAALREHLLDLFADSWNAAASGLAANPWLGKLRLFRAADERMLSWEAISGLGGGERPVLVTPPHPPRLLGAFKDRPDRVSRIFSGTRWVAGVERNAGPRRDAKNPAPERGAAAPAAKAAPEDWLEALRAFLKGPLRCPPDVLPRRFAQELSLRFLPPPPANGLALLTSGGREERHAPLVKRTPKGAWILNGDHPAFEALLEFGDAERGAPYLASLVYSAVNRQFQDVTDLQEIRFQGAVAAAADGFSGPPEAARRRRARKPRR